MKRGSIKVCTADKTQKGAKKESKNAQNRKHKNRSKTNTQ